MLKTFFKTWVHIAVRILSSKVFHRVRKIFLLSNFKSHVDDGDLQLDESSQCLSQVVWALVPRKRAERTKRSMALYQSPAQAMAEPGIKPNCLESYISSFYDMKRWLWWGEKKKNRVRNPLLQIKINWGLASYSALSKGSHSTCQDGILGSDIQKYWPPMASQQNPCQLQVFSISNCSLATIFNVAIAMVPRCSIFTAAEQL